MSGSYTLTCQRGEEDIPSYHYTERNIKNFSFGEKGRGIFLCEGGHRYGSYPAMSIGLLNPTIILRTLSVAVEREIPVNEITMSAKTTNYILTFITLVGIPLLVIWIIRNNPVTVATVIGLTILVPSLILLVIARLQLGGSFSVTPQAKELVTTGIYSRIRHPIYLFAQLTILGIVLCVHHTGLLAAWGVLVCIQFVRSRREEKVLEEKFGDVYRAYKKKTWF